MIGTSLIAEVVPGAEISAIPRIGVLVPSLLTAPLEQELREGLREFGYVEGKNIVLEWRRYTPTDHDLQTLAAELAQASVDVIVTSGTPATQAALTGTTRPVVFTVVSDPVASGFAASLADPGGRATGVSILATDLAGKRLELLHQMVPRATRILYLTNSSNSISARALEEVQAAAHTLNLKLVALDVQDGAEIDAVFRARSYSPTDAVLVAADYVFVVHKAKVAENVRKLRLPAMVAARWDLDEGLLMSYGPNPGEAMRRAALYVDKILKGAKPAELPIERVSKYELIIDLRVAGALGLTVPQSLLLRADELRR